MSAMSATFEWKRMLNVIFCSGREHSPRGARTAELLAHTTQVNMRRPVINIPRRGLNYRFMAAEAEWILSGSNRLEDIAKYCKQMRHWSDDRVFMRGAYGPMVVDQISYAAEALARDRETRQSVISIWRPSPRPSNNIPCTIAMQFLIRDEEICCNVFMRSSDIWLGWPYDVFTFTMIAWYVGLLANQMSVGMNIVKELGTLSIFAGSLHLYEENCKEAREMANAKWSPQDDIGYDFNHFKHPEDIMVYLCDAMHHPNETFQQSPITRLRAAYPAS